MKDKFLKIFSYTYDELNKKNGELILPMYNELNLKELEQIIRLLDRKQKESHRIPRSVLEKSSILLYETIRKPISRTKNSQLSIIIFLLYLEINNYWIKIQLNKFYNLIKWVKISDPEIKTLIIKGIEKIISCYIKKNTL